MVRVEGYPDIFEQHTLCLLFSFVQNFDLLYFLGRGWGGGGGRGRGSEKMTILGMWRFWWIVFRG